MKKKSYIILLLLILFTFKSVALDNKMDNEKYIIVIVSQGDTLWSISKEYAPKDDDIRKFIYKLKNINEKHDSILIPGETLLVPIE